MAKRTKQRSAAQPAQGNPGVARSAAGWAPIAVGLGAYLCAAILITGILGFTTRWYDFFDMADAPVYHGYAMAMDRGLRPFVDFPAEYPSAALRLFDLPGHPAGLEQYAVWFATIMLIAMGGAAVLVSAAAVHLWPRRSSAGLVAGTFAVSVLALGAIVANRFDAAVALFLALFFWALASRRWVLAGFALGLGTALKLTPAVLLPLPLLLATRWRYRATTVLAFGIATVGPFLVDGAAAWSGLVGVFRFHGARPLQAESLLASPLLLAHLLGLGNVRMTDAFGSQAIEAPGARVLALLSGPLALLLVLVVLALAWRARRHSMEEPRWLSLFGLALLLAVIVPAKVLSPQYLVWLVPAVALLAPAAPGLAGLLVATFLLTQIEFPSLYWRFIELHPGPVLLVAARNLGLAAALGWALVLLARDGSAPTADGLSLTVPHGDGVGKLGGRGAPGKAGSRSG